ncbi:MAG: ImmA/IrrE family metallo-endopeptidase [Candidatus Thiothrix moscowensis]|nr:ImmA/IrrE family metallo-endopeptidase [Candidatus Thiothrix moscowensis]
MKRQTEHGFCHDKLKLARLAAGKSYLDIGEMLGVTRQYAHKLEVNAIPSDSQIQSLAGHLLVTEDFFFSPRKRPLELEQCHFRSVRSSTQTLKKMIAAQVEIFEGIVSHLEDEVAFPLISITDIGDADITSIDNIERLAERFRRELDLGLGPISNMTKLAEKVGTLVINVVEADDRVDAFSLFNERPLIVRNTAKVNPCRLRFDIAHEMGHLVLHQGIETGCRLTEEQANQFASALLMPRASFSAEFPRMRGRYLNWPALKEMKLRWRVSFKALIYRASKLGLLTPEQAKSGFVYLSRHGYTKTEEFDEQIPMEEPSMVQRAIDLLDYSTWKRVLDTSGLTCEAISSRYLLTVPKPHLSLVRSIGIA